jgi:hypothetical protein
VCQSTIQLSTADLRKCLMKRSLSQFERSCRAVVVGYILVILLMGLLAPIIHNDGYLTIVCLLSVPLVIGLSIFITLLPILVVAYLIRRITRHKEPWERF